MYLCRNINAGGSWCIFTSGALRESVLRETDGPRAKQSMPRSVYETHDSLNSPIVKWRGTAIDVTKM